MPTYDYRWNHVPEAHERHPYTVPVYTGSTDRAEFVVEKESGRRNVSGRQLINEQRANLIAQTMDTPEGRSAMAQAMVAPLRRFLDYQGIGRSLLMVDELPQGSYARYEKDLRIEVVGREEDALYEWLAFYSNYKEDIMLERIAKERFTNAIEQLDV